MCYIVSIFCLKLTKKEGHRLRSLILKGQHGIFSRTNERQNNSQIPDLSFFTISDVFFCGGGLESDDSFLLWQTTQGFNAEKKTPNEFSKTILQDTSRLVTTCNENSSDPDLSFFPSSEGRFGGGGRGWRWRGSGGRGALGSGGSFLNEKHTFELSWVDSWCEWCEIWMWACRDPDLGGGGWRWKGRGAIGAFGSGGTFLMWKSTFVLSFHKNLTLNSLKHAPTHAWPLFLYFQWRSPRWRRGRSRSVRTRMSRGRVFDFLPGQITTVQIRALQLKRPRRTVFRLKILLIKTHLSDSAQHAPCTAGFPVRPWVWL